MQNAEFYDSSFLPAQLDTYHLSSQLKHNAWITRSPQTQQHRVARETLFLLCYAALHATLEPVNHSLCTLIDRTQELIRPPSNRSLHKTLVSSTPNHTAGSPPWLLLTRTGPCPHIPIPHVVPGSSASRPLTSLLALGYSSRIVNMYDDVVGVGRGNSPPVVRSLRAVLVTHIYKKHGWCIV